MEIEVRNITHDGCAGWKLEWEIRSQMKGRNSTFL